MKVMDNYHNQVMHFYRPPTCGFTDSIEISAPVGQMIGRIDQEFTLIYPNFKVKNHNNETVLRIEGPACKTSLLGDVVFKVKNLRLKENAIL